MSAYIFKSERLGFRNWTTKDIDKLFELNTNDKVMKYFPSKVNFSETEQFISRMQKMYEEEKFCYFAVELITTKEFIGFIGLSKQTYEIDFNPSVDIGWRLHPNFWGKGFASEGAKASLAYGFEQLRLTKIVSVAPIINKPSIAVMQKVGMQKIKEFKHPYLINTPSLETCVLYQIENA